MTLKDFKAAVDRQGTFRYHFKALDPEFGTVKEEVGSSITASIFPSWLQQANLKADIIIIVAAATQRCRLL